MGWVEEEKRCRRADYESSLFVCLSLPVILHLPLSVTVWLFLLSLLFTHPLSLSVSISLLLSGFASLFFFWICRVQLCLSPSIPHFTSSLGLVYPFIPLSLSLSVACSYFSVSVSFILLLISLFLSRWLSPACSAGRSHHSFSSSVLLLVFLCIFLYHSICVSLFLLACQSLYYILSVYVIISFPCVVFVKRDPLKSAGKLQATHATAAAWGGFK